MPISVENVDMILIQHRVTTDVDVPQTIMKKMGHKIDTNFYITTCVSLISTHHLPGLIMDYTNYNGLI